MLSTAHHALDGDAAISSIYKSCQPTNRFSKWVQESDANYQWLHALCTELNVLHKERTGQDHASALLLPTLSTLPVNIPKGELSPVPIAESSDVVQTIYGLNTVLGHREYLCEKFTSWIEAGKSPRFKVRPAWLC
ncbi:DNA binding protein [Vibrio phage K449]